MKQLVISIVCACMALAAVAGVPKPHDARVKQALKNRPVAAATSVGERKSGQVSFHQLMRERDLTPNDNRLLSKAPRRLSPSELAGDRVAVAEAWPFVYDDAGDLIVGDMAFSMGWNASIGNDSSINRFYGSFSIPFIIDDGTPYISSCILKQDTVKGSINLPGGVGNFTRTDTITWTVCIVNDDWGDDDGNLELWPGTIYDDGTIQFDEYYYVYTELEVNKYRVRHTGEIIELISSEYSADISPVFNNLYLLNPNGIHECDYRIKSSTFPLDNDTTLVAWTSLIVTGEGGSGEGGSGSSGYYVVTDEPSAQTGGLHPHPIDPRRTPDALYRYDDPWGQNVQWQDELNGTIQAPVFMFQLDDSTLCIYNLYNAGYTANVMTLHPDGSLTVPPQVMLYDAFYGEDFYNCSLEGDSLFWGNTGIVTCDSITWDTTVPHSVVRQHSHTFDNNKLYLNDGYQFELPDILGDVNRDKRVSITDVTVLINHLLNQDFEKTEEFNPESSDINKDDAVTIRDVTMLINYLLSHQSTD